MMAAQLRMRDAAGTLRTITQLRMRDAAGTLRTITRVRMRDADNVLRIVYDPSGATAFSASASNSHPHGITQGTGTCTTNSTTITPVNGTAPYTYAWALLSYEAGVAPTASGPTSAATDFVQTGMGPGDFFTAEWRCTVTDDLGLITTVDVSTSFVDVS